LGFLVIDVMIGVGFAVFWWGHRRSKEAISWLEVLLEIRL